MVALGTGFGLEVTLSQIGLNSHAWPSLNQVRTNSTDFFFPLAYRMLTASVVKSMSRSRFCVARRTKAIAQHMMSTAATPADVSPIPAPPPIAHSPWIYQPPVVFESNLALRSYILNRPLKLNALDEPMLSLLRPKIEVTESRNCF